VTATGVVASSAGPGEQLTAASEGVPGRLRELLRSRRLVTGLGIVGFFVVLGVAGPFFVSDPNQLSPVIYGHPSTAHWLGTTSIGQDVFAQLVYGTRASLEIGGGAGLLATVISIGIGIGGGYAGGTSTRPCHCCPTSSW
jgi:peptide/nickel transport system permease protein